MRLNILLHRALRLVRDHALVFLRRELKGTLVGVFLGAVLAIIYQIATSDAVLTVVKTRWASATAHAGVNDFKNYKLALGMIALAGTTAILFWTTRFIWRALLSWMHAVVSGVTLTTALTFFYFIAFRPLATSFSNVAGAIAASIAFCLLNFALLIRSLVASENPPKLEYVLPSGKGAQTPDSWRAFNLDKPIEDWDEDILNRASLVEAMATYILVSRVPVIALRGAFGEGKTSILNLLRRTIARNAIVVTFSTWLPGTEANLAGDLLNDVATECRKKYLVPQFRKRLINYAQTVTGNISYLKALSEILPRTSQRDDIEELRQALGRLPQRIVILLDEIDRMQAEELRVLLKLIRGAATFPNLTYVCAFKRESLEEMLFQKSDARSSDYFEKFFPLTVDLPKQDAHVLRSLFQGRLLHIFDDLRRFDSIVTRKDFEDTTDEFWDTCLIKVCTNLRKLGSLLNDIEAVARPISQEVHPFDLTVIEIIRRFFPSVYERIWLNPLYFTNAGFSWKTVGFRSDKQAQAERDAFFKALDESLPDGEVGQSARFMLQWIFPNFSDYCGNRTSRYLRAQGSKGADEADEEKRIYHPDYFPIYFRYQVPAAMFSTAELSAFLSGMNAAKTEAERFDVFAGTFGALQKGSPRRYDFFNRLPRSVTNLNDVSAESLAYALAMNAHEYIYDILNMGEADRVIASVFQIAQRFETSDRIQRLLIKAIEIATDDTFAFKLLSFLTASRDKNKIITNFKYLDDLTLRKVFCGRMRKQYGLEVNASGITLAQADQQAFNFWARYSDAEREIEVNFWTRFIGSSRKRLAQAFNFIFPRNTLWESDPTPAVDVLYPVEQLRGLADTLAADESLDEVEEHGLERLAKLLNGDFKGGINFPVE